MMVRSEDVSYLKKQCESDPLVVGDVSAFVLVVVWGREDARVCDLVSHVEGEGPGDGVGGVDPAEGVENVLEW